LLLVMAALVFAAVGVSTFLLAEDRGINPAWVFAAWFALGFIVSVGRSMREKFSSPGFVPYFLGWLLLHVLISLVVIGYGWLLFSPVVYCFELALGYIIAVRLFGPVRKRS
jgi:hypothetical protein